MVTVVALVAVAQYGGREEDRTGVRARERDGAALLLLDE